MYSSHTHLCMHVGLCIFLQSVTFRGPRSTILFPLRIGLQVAHMGICSAFDYSETFCIIHFGSLSRFQSPRRRPTHRRKRLPSFTGKAADQTLSVPFLWSDHLFSIQQRLFFPIVSHRLNSRQIYTLCRHLILPYYYLLCYFSAPVTYL
jgi:hypothetical protein